MNENGSQQSSSEHIFDFQLLFTFGKCCSQCAGDIEYILNLKPNKFAFAMDFSRIGRSVSSNINNFNMFGLSVI